jgi:aspartyl-tRNA synthetase
MKTIAILETNQSVGEQVRIKGWVQTIRDMGKITFLDVRDHTGLLQVVVPAEINSPKLSLEYVVDIVGEVRTRGERYVNSKLATGAVEMEATEIVVLNESLELPFEIKKDTSGINEELRLKYRYLDLRSERMASNLRLRHKVIKFFRDYLDAQGFIEVETPMLNKGTPEGAREFLVPSRLHAEQFYVLPQSPQQFKQLLMVGGIGRYFQIARAFRDEDQRGDRQPEFTQLDLEMSFVEQEDILALNEAMFVEMVKSITPEKHLTAAPFPRLTYAESMEKYGNDKPDLRVNKNDPDELAFAWVVDFPMFEKVDEGNGIGAMHHPFTSPKTEDMGLLDTDPLRVRADSFDLVLNGYEISSGSIRIHEPELQKRMFEILGLSDEEINAKFGHMIEAFKYGAPPHGGMAPGLDRLLMLLAGEPNIREVMAFPKTGDARDPLTGAPSLAGSKALDEAHIATVPVKKN